MKYWTEENCRVVCKAYYDGLSEVPSHHQFEIEIKGWFCWLSLKDLVMTRTTCRRDKVTFESEKAACEYIAKHNKMVDLKHEGKGRGYQKVGDYIYCRDIK